MPEWFCQQRSAPPPSTLLTFRYPLSLAAVRKEQDKLRKDKVKEIFKILSFPFNSEEEESIFYHYSFFLVDDVCHKIVFDEELKDIDLCIEKCVNMLCGLFEDCTNYKNRMKE